MTDQAPIDLEWDPHEGYLEARFLGGFSVERFNSQVLRAVASCRDRSLKRLFIDTTRLDADLAMHDRFEIAIHGADAAVGLKVVLLSLPSQIDPRKFGILVARNRGLQVDVFPDHQTALDWLMETEAPSP